MEWLLVVIVLGAIAAAGVWGWREEARQSSEKQRGGRRWLLYGGLGGLVLLGVVFFVGVLIGSRGTKDTSNTDPGNRDLAPGDAANVGGVRVTLLEAFGTDADTSDRELYLPSDEYTFVVTRFRVHNTSGKEFKLAGEGWLKPRSDAGTTLDPVALLRQGQPTTPREERYIGDTPIVEAGADVTGTLAFVARRDEAVSVEFYNDFVQRKPDAAWNLGPVSKLPERPFLATR